MFWHLWLVLSKTLKSRNSSEENILGELYEVVVKQWEMGIPRKARFFYLFIFLLSSATKHILFLGKKNLYNGFVSEFLSLFFLIIGSCQADSLFVVWWSSHGQRKWSGSGSISRAKQRIFRRMRLNMEVDIFVLYGFLLGW